MLSTVPDTIIVPPIPARTPLKTPLVTPPTSAYRLPDAEVQRMLAFLDPDMEYGDWLKVGMALHADGHSLNVWDKWSRGGTKYEEGVCNDKWLSFSADNAASVTMGTLVHMAREAGWVRTSTTDTAPITPIQFIEPATLQGQLIPAREWLVPDWIPMPYTTALYGDGGTGKSLLAMQLMTAAATGKHWLGQQVKPVKALGFFCEDTVDELHFRQAQINQAYGCNFSDLGNMVWYSGVGEDNTLVAFDNGRDACLTALYQQLEQKVLEFKPQLIVIDTAADTFGGNENARRDVRIFISRLNKLAAQVKGAVVLCAHPSVAGMTSGRGDGGNTAWNNSVRSRIYLRRPPADKDALPVDANIRLLSRMKSNYSAANDELMLLWQNGAFTTIGAIGSNPGDTSAKAAHEKHVEECFLKALDDLEAQGRNLSVSKNSTNHAPKLLRQNPHCHGLSMKELEAAMERLFAARKIKNELYGRKSNPAKKIVRAGAIYACTGTA